ncbi:MAG: menaquinone biosynthesis decarboxylase [Campylobacteraceae bacterium]|jgi:4-hydroxy-3-polyprenylbenzoate decarboxylase|nr:menaquinone biosynthesis decarboxylase [Campylobacteraceae bacterium]
MQNTIDLLKENGLLRVIGEPVDIDLEMSHIAYIEAKKSDSKALLFLKPISKRLGKEFPMPVLMNTFCSHKAVEIIFGRKVDEISNEIEELIKMKMPSGIAAKAEFLAKMVSLKNVPPKRIKGKGLCQEFIKKDEKVNLYNLPILTTWSKDAGPFITMGQVYTQSLDGKRQNLGMYRLQVYDKNHLGMHWQIHKDGMHFFHEYKKAGVKMPVSVAIGGDPLYIWCGQAPMPNGFFELLLYGIIKEKNAKLVKSLTNEIYIPYDADIVLEGYVDPKVVSLEGPFGDHTGFYTPKEEYPAMNVTCITSKHEPVYHATVVGKPPLEDKYMGYATERIFLPLLKTTTPDLIDYKMPENGVFHNLILAKMSPQYYGHAKQFMHAFWGVGQMSFVKHAIFVDENAPQLDDYKNITKYILNRIDKKNILISEGVCDVLDHASNISGYGGKLGIDCTGEEVEVAQREIINDNELFRKMADVEKSVKSLCQYEIDTKTPICVIAVKKEENVRNIFEKLKIFKNNTRLLVFVDYDKDTVTNPYMLVWKVVNNIDAQRDLFIDDDIFGIDATSKNREFDNYLRVWPQSVECDKGVIGSLQKRGLIDVDEELLRKYWI